KSQKIFLLDLSNGKTKPCILKNIYSFKSENIFWENGRPGLFVIDGRNLFSIKATRDKNVFTTEWLCKQLPTNCIISSIYYDESNHLIYTGTDCKGSFIFKDKYFK